MYERFFGLVDVPFRLTPDPRYLFRSAKHADALAHLRLGLAESSGFVCITGDVGTGKTTVLRHFLSELGPEVSAAYVVNPTLSALELLQTVCAELGLPADTESRLALVDRLNRHLLAERQAGRTCIVVVDEAQALAIDVLEQLRLLSNLETTTEKLLRVILVGQPQLRALLVHPELVQLNQRITLRWHIGPLTRAETAAYIQHRVAVASGGQRRDLFTRQAVGLIHRRAAGVPRLVNMLCHRAMLAAYAAGEQRVGRRAVVRALREVESVPLPVRPASPMRRVWIGAGALAAAAGLAVVAVQAWPPRVEVEPVPEPAAMAERAVDAAVADAAVAHEAEPAVAVAAPAAEPAGAAPAGGEPAAADVVGAASVPAAQPAAPDAAAPTAAVAPTELAAVQPAPAAADPPAAQPVAAPAPDPVAAFESRLAALSPQQSAHDALATVLSAWHVRALGPGEGDDPADFAQVAERRGLEQLALSGNTAMLRLLDVPAVIELRLPGANGPRWAALLGLGNGSALLAAGEGSPVLVSQAVLDKAWFGQTHVFWRDFESLGPSAIDGAAQGPRVARLQTLLARAGAYGGPATGVFDAPTDTAVREFQRSRYLTADGLVGRLTRVVLYAAAGGYPRPTLALPGSTS